MQGRIILLIGLATAYLLTSCGVPYDVENVMVTEIKNNYQDAKSIKFVRSDRKVLTDADKANGITQQWCILASFVYYRENSFWDDGLFGFRAYLKNDKWEYYFPQYFSSATWYGGWETYAQYLDDDYRKCIGYP
jgi:hypothetical protein